VHADDVQAVVRERRREARHLRADGAPGSRAAQLALGGRGLGAALCHGRIAARIVRPGGGRGGAEALYLLAQSLPVYCDHAGGMPPDLSTPALPCVT